MYRSKQGRVRLKARVSAAKLGEYLAAPAHRRERIIHDQKYLSPFIVARYTRANNAIRASLLGGGDVSGRLLSKASLIENDVATSSFQAEVNQGSAHAVRSFAKLVPALPLNGVTFAMTGTQSFYSRVEGVEISAAPVVLLQRTKRDGSTEVGALMTVMTKQVKLSDHSGRAVAELLRQALLDAGYTNVRPRLCLIVDVFAGTVFYAPSARKRLSSEIASACREIAVRWPAIAA